MSKIVLPRIIPLFRDMNKNINSRLSTDSKYDSTKSTPWIHNESKDHLYQLKLLGIWSIDVFNNHKLFHITISDIYSWIYFDTLYHAVTRCLSRISIGWITAIIFLIAALWNSVINRLLVLEKPRPYEDIHTP